MDFKKYYNPYKAGTQEYRNKEIANLESFHDDALELTGMTGHPDAETYYSLAWKFGHEGGLPEVFHHLKCLVAMGRESYGYGLQ